MPYMKSIFVLLLLTAILGLVPLAQAAAKPETTIAGASAMWQSLALAAYALACPTQPCATSKGIQGGHWTSASNTVNLEDTRVSPANVDAGTLWIVWNAGATRVWSFNKVDSVVGTRCYFAQPKCTVIGPLTTGEAGAGQISSALWGADSDLPQAVAELFAAGTPVNVAATLVRPEDAAFLTCRTNSVLGAGSYGGAASDGLDGLGYNAVNAAGVCPANGLGQASGAYVGTPIKSGYPGSTGQANVLAFNISGVDPISGTAIPTATVVKLGAAPLVFIIERNEGQLTNLQNASDEQLQQAFSGKNCDASAFGLPAGGINIFQNEPISGQGNVAEATVFRKPTVYNGTGGGAIIGISQEANVNGPVNNPLAGQAGTCLSADGGRYRAIGSSEEVKAVQNSGAKFGGRDGIGYNVFSYGNVSTIANNPNYGYIELNGVDPIFDSYTGADPGQPGNGTLPAAANLPASCSSSFPCAENAIWEGGLSFPNLRNGTYSSWTILRLVSNGAGLTAAEALEKRASDYVVTSVPDFVPISKTVVDGITDPGLLLVRSHYQQYDGGGNAIGVAPLNKGTTEAGADLGGCILKSSGSGSTKTQNVNADYPNCVARPGGQ
jgi:hypothetical protein